MNVLLLLWPVLGAPLVPFDPTYAPIERITFSASFEGGGVPTKWPSSQKRQRKLTEVGDFCELL